MSQEDPIGENHVATSLETPMRKDAFDLSDEEKVEQITEKFAEIMDILGLDLKDDSLSGTPRRVAKMYVKEIFSGLNPKNLPAATLFENKFSYDHMLVEKNIPIWSFCEHHFVPIIGKAHVAYLPQNRVIGLSKIHRIVHHYARRPQVQERLTKQVANHLCKILGTKDIAVVIDASHTCVSARGVKDHGSSTITSELRGQFSEQKTRLEFLNFIKGD